MKSPQVREVPRMPAGADLVREWLAHSPFVARLGMRVAAIEPDLARIEMPFAPENVTIGDVVHGGAIGALIDTAATAAAWSAADAPENIRGTTVGLTVTYVAAARSTDLAATARVVRRGKSLCFCDVDVVAADGTIVAKGLVTYKLG